MTDVVIVGGAASGLVAACQAGSLGLSVVLLEKEARVGRKLLSTGNGQCNLSNRDLSFSHFHGSLMEQGIGRKVIEAVSFDRVEDFWREIGIEYVEQQRGKLYPRSLQASSVLNALRRRLEDLGVKVMTEKEVKRIQQGKRSLKVYLSDGGCIEGKTVILTAGGKASPALGSKGEGYAIASGLHLKVSPLRPGICRVLSSSPYCKRLGGLRMTVPCRLVAGEEILETTEGEVLFTEEGLSGPAILDLSRKAGEMLEEGKEVSVQLDLASEMKEGEVFGYLTERLRRLSSWSLEDALEGWLPKKIIPVVLLMAKVEKTVVSGDVDKRSLTRLVKVLKGFAMPLSGLAGFKEAQVTVGGILAEEVTAELEAKKVPGLFLAGEILDLDGDCGGYNLLWAAASGMKAAESAYSFVYKEIHD